MVTRRPRPSVRQAVAFLVLTVHATAWLVVLLVQPSTHAVLTCLSAYGAALALLALILSGRGGTG